MSSAEQPKKRPNFLVIVADDLGFSDVGPYGGEIATPNLWRLARDGVRMTNFHTASACSPTRSMLFSGTDNHIAGLGQMSEHMRAFGDYFKGKPGYEGYLNWRVAALPEILQDAGYFTVLSGKWHLGLQKELAPCSRGFTKNFSFLPGSGNHYSFEPQLNDDEIKIPCLNTDGFWMDGERFIDRNTELPGDFYSTTSFTDRLVGFLDERTSQEQEQPFFAALTFTAPHWPLQAPKDVREKYRGKYDDGPDELTKRRIKRMTELGLIEPGVEPAPPVGVLGKEWHEITEEERRISARKMETFAAMVEVIDTNIGRVLDYLESTDELDNTFILFMSDNGAEGAMLEALPMMGGAKTMGGIIQKYYDNTLENIGEASSFVWYGPRWACAATAPSRGTKVMITEGGIRCPCVIRYPPLTTAATNTSTTPSNQITHSFTTVMDILPTILELAGVPHPGTTFRNRPVVLPRGKSWVPHLSSADSSVHGEDTHVHGWELFGQRAIREGPWKAVWINKPRGKDDWELYHVEKDPGELHDLCDEEPEVLRRLVDHWEVYYAETGMIQTPVFAVTNS
ncbi:alkaline-phosphatase-like protein [Astrocystis sublimbata]|nr:alkaline-phosphatase-like protein [Astrocystis sublimbata]